MSGRDEQWIVIPNWTEFQHYKNRDPRWIKSYTRLLGDPDYLALSFRLRGILHGIWLLYAASDGLVSGSSPARLGRMLGEDTVRTRDIEALNHAGFLTLSASKPLALRYQAASPEVEREKEPPYPLSQNSEKRRSPSARAAQTNGTYPCAAGCQSFTFKTERQLRDHLEVAHWWEPEQIDAVLNGERVPVLKPAERSREQTIAETGRDPKHEAPNAGDDWAAIDREPMENPSAPTEEAR